MGKTTIGWTDISWNPGIYGCTEISPACANCYAATMAHRLVSMGRYPAGITRRNASGVHWTGHVEVAEQVQSLHHLPKKKPARVFVTSMSDLFHEAVPDRFIDRVFGVMSARQHLIFQVLTKRPERAAQWWRGAHSSPDPARCRLMWPPNVWIGATVEDQHRAEERIPHLLQIPAPVRFLSVEPMCGPVDLRALRGERCARCDQRVAYDALSALCRCGCTIEGPEGVDWGEIHQVIVGCESLGGRPGRPVPLDWVRSLRDQCQQAGVAFFLKQLAQRDRVVEAPELDGRIHLEFPEVGRG